MSQILDPRIVGVAVGFPRNANSVPYSDTNDPIPLFQTWFQEAIDSEIKEPTAMTVATVDPDGYPDARMLLLKGVDDRGLVFYTNMGSPKAQTLLHDPRVALCFYWGEIGKQVRVRGRASVAE